METIKIENLTKNFGSFQVLHNLNMEVKKGEIFGFVGRNGAGKSTLINILTGIVNKSGGSFSILGVQDNQLDSIKKRVGVMPDVSNLYSHMKGIDFLRYMGSLVGDKRTKSELQNLLMDVGLEGAEKKKIKTYSFGMKKKICIAQALLGNPELIILDEPTSGLDPESAIIIQKLIFQLKEKGMTIFLTSHNLDEIEKVSDRIAILKKGVIKKVGTPRELKMESKELISISVRTKPMITNELTQVLKQTSGLNLSFIQTKSEYSFLQLNSDEILPQFLKSLMDMGIEVYEIRVEERSLEDVFMNV